MPGFPRVICLTRACLGCAQPRDVPEALDFIARRRLNPSTLDYLYLTPSPVRPRADPACVTPCLATLECHLALTFYAWG